MTTDAGMSVPPEVLTRVQFFAMLGDAGIITEREAGDADPGRLPNAFTVFSGSLPEWRRLIETVFFRENLTFHPYHPIVWAFFERRGMYSDQVAPLWRAGARR